MAALAALATLSSSGLASVARAWTTASVEDVRGRVVLDEDGHAEVTLDLGVRVRGGWLERFDLDGLGDGLTMCEPRPAELETEDGLTLLPRVQVRAGSVSVRFEKRDAARRGLHRLRLFYHRSLVEPTDMGALAFALPGFQQAIGAAEIVVDAPASIAPVRDPESTTLLRERRVGERRELTFSRTHWPRATPWRFALSRQSGPARAGISATRSAPSGSLWSPVFLTVLSSAVAWLLRASFRRAARGAGLRTQPWVRAAPVLLAARGAFILLAIAGYRASPALSIAGFLGLALSWTERVLPAHEPVRLSHARAVSRADRALVRRAQLWASLGVRPFGDVISVLGAVSASGLFAVLWWHPESASLRDPWALCLACLFIPLSACSRLRLSRSFGERLVRLSRACRDARLSGCAFRLVTYVDAEERLVEPRLRVVPAARYSGLLRIDVCCDSRRGIDALSLVVVVVPGSAVDGFLEVHLGRARRTLSLRGRRAAYVQRIDGLDRALDELLGVLARETQALLPTLLDRLRAA
jgi:hypothetical protein